LTQSIHGCFWDSVDLERVNEIFAVLIYWISRAGVLGEECGQWAQGAFDTRGVQALRSIMGLCDLIKQHSVSAINNACAKALKAGTYRFKDLRRLIGQQTENGLHPRR
jgi:hypothetical protein